MIRTKCDNCKNVYVITTDDGHHDIVCLEGHWQGDDSDGTEDCYLDIWDGCKDFKEGN